VGKEHGRRGGVKDYFQDVGYLSYERGIAAETYY
jgi:hypothetical protein